MAFAFGDLWGILLRFVMAGLDPAIQFQKLKLLDFIPRWSSQGQP